MSRDRAPLKVTALGAAAQLGGTERVLLDFANRAFEDDVALRVITPVDGPLVAILNKIGVPAEVVPAPPAMLAGSQQEGHLGSLPRAFLGLTRWARTLKRHPWMCDADVVYSISFKTHIAAALARVHPYVWHLHEFPPPAAPRIWKWLAHHFPDALIANSDAAGRTWSGRRTAEPPNRLVVVRNGVNLDRFRPRERTGWIHRELGIPADARLIGMPAVFARWKGQVEVMLAFELIRDEFPDTHLVIVGGSIYDTVAEQRYGEELERITGEWKIADLRPPTAPHLAGESGVRSGTVRGGARSGTGDAAPTSPEASEGPTPYSPLPTPRVHLLPFQREIELAFVEFDLAVHYSTRPEPFGRVVLEAMACGVPVIAADEGGPVEILRTTPESPCEGGWLAPPRNPEALAEVLRAALRLQPAEVAAVGAAGRRRAEDRFSARGFSGKLADVLWGVAG